MNSAELYSVEDAAAFLGGISKWTVHAWLSQGRLQRVKVGSRTMIRKSELEAFISACNPKQAASGQQNKSDIGLH